MDYAGKIQLHIFISRISTPFSQIVVVKVVNTSSRLKKLIYEMEYFRNGCQLQNGCTHVEKAVQFMTHCYKFTVIKCITPLWVTEIIDFVCHSVQMATNSV